MLQLKSIGKSFGATVVLKDISLNVGRGEFISLLGPSGCGKTTLLRIVAGLESLSMGRVFIGGRDVTDRDASQRDIAMVFQSYALYPHKSVGENIAFPIRMHAPWQAAIPLFGSLTPAGKALKKEIEIRVPKVAHALGLGELVHRRPAQLSGGQKQRVALARALVRDPLLFLMDEPLSNLDAALRAEMRSEIMELHRKTGCTFIYVTHDQTEAMTMSQRIVLLDKGSIRQAGTPLELYDNPNNLFTASFIGSPKLNVLPYQHSPGVVRLNGCLMRSLEAHETAAHLKEKAASVGLRAEAMKLCAPAHADAIHCRVRLIEQMGNETVVFVETDAMPGSRLAVRVARSEGNVLSEGEVLALRPEWSRALFFDVGGDRVRLRNVRRQAFLEAA
ncbi:MAG: ABC transporter ATP-binding protein [Candidatus Accumulibacter sp.]|jgi:multiple sugar transport system ATP-binding protein|nr:ABC transporter ATP-binding protein [Accumulibacter sp.]